MPMDATNGFLFASFGESPSTVVSTCCKNPKPSITLCCSMITGIRFQMKHIVNHWTIYRLTWNVQKLQTYHRRQTLVPGLLIEVDNLPIVVNLNQRVHLWCTAVTHPSTKQAPTSSVSQCYTVVDCSDCNQNLLSITSCDLMVYFYASGIRAERQGIDVQHRYIYIPVVHWHTWDGDVCICVLVSLQVSK
jgi:hypothetical protein